MTTIILLQLFAIAALFTAIYFLAPIVRGAVYFPTKPANVEAIVRLAEIKSGEKAVDLGSGDGRIVIALARAGAEAHGYEINPLLVWRSRTAIRRAGLDGRAFVHWRSFWGVNLSDFSLVTAYGIPYIMRSLERKLRRELRSGARVISNIYPFPSWKFKSRVPGGVLLYVRE